MSITSEEQITEYQNVLDEGLGLICAALNVEAEFYDTDQSDFACYLDCFKQAAESLRKYGIRYNMDTGEFQQIGEFL